jgi:hypothetical protein
LFWFKKVWIEKINNIFNLFNALKHFIIIFFRNILVIW